MKFYIATKLENHAEHNRIRDILESMGDTCSYDWTTHGPVYMHGKPRIREVAMAEFNGVRHADYVVVLAPGGRGTHVELGMAIAMHKRTFIISTDPVDFSATKGTCAFYHHPFVVQLSSVEELVQALKIIYDEEENVRDLR